MAADLPGQRRLRSTDDRAPGTRHVPPRLGARHPDRRRTRVTTGRVGRPDEIAAAVTFLASRHADYISGADLRVDGVVVRTVS
ncbi:SDR family oxidoreductase [Mycobacterium sp. C31M]